EGRYGMSEGRGRSGSSPGPLPVAGGRRGAIRGTENKAGLWFPSGDLASHGLKAGPLGGGGLQPPGIPHPPFAFTLDPQGSFPSAPRLVRQALEALTIESMQAKMNVTGINTGNDLQCAG
ncbi:MAG: hypothetical protein DRN64_04570, partial [Thaumarchaeota archaeon]